VCVSVLTHKVCVSQFSTLIGFPMEIFCEELQFLLENSIEIPDKFDDAVANRDKIVLNNIVVESVGTIKNFADATKKGVSYCKKVEDYIAKGISHELKFMGSVDAQVKAAKIVLDKVLSAATYIC
jgi:hypothetical protein